MEYCQHKARDGNGVMENLLSEVTRENSQRSSWNSPKDKNDCVAQGMGQERGGNEERAFIWISNGHHGGVGRKGYIWSGIMENLVYEEPEQQFYPETKN